MPCRLNTCEAEHIQTMTKLSPIYTPHLAYLIGSVWRELERRICDVGSITGMKYRTKVINTTVTQVITAFELTYFIMEHKVLVFYTTVVTK
jgi:hypothetical protein